MAQQTNWLYTDKVLEHFMNPKNILLDEASYKEDGRGLVGNVKCGDQMIVAIQVDRESGTIKDCKWKTYGCASAIASTSIIITVKQFIITNSEISKLINYKS